MFTFQGSLYSTEDQRNAAAAYEWLTAGGLNSVESCLALTQSQIEHELLILRRCEPEMHGWVVAGYVDAIEQMLGEVE